MNLGLVRQSWVSVKSKKIEKIEKIFFSSKMIGDHCGTKFQSFFALTGDDRCDDRCQKIEKKSKIIFFLKMMEDHFGTKFPSFFTLTGVMTGVKK